MQTYRNEFFIKRDFGFYDSGILGCLPSVTFDIYEVIRRWVWRSLESGDPESRRLFAKGQLATTMAQSEIAEALGRDRKTINGHIAGMKDLGWLQVVPAKDHASAATYILGERVKDGQGRSHEVFFADSWMKGLWSRLEVAAMEEIGEGAKVHRLSWDRRREICRSYLAENSSDGGGSEGSDDDSEDDTGSFSKGDPGEKLDRGLSDFLDRGCPENGTPGGGGLSRKIDTERREVFLPEDTGNNKGRRVSAAAPRGRSHWDAPRRRPLTPGLPEVNEDQQDSGDRPAADRLAVVRAVAAGEVAPRLDVRAEAWKEKAERERERQDGVERARQRRLANFDGTKPYEVRQAIKHLEGVWKAEMKGSFGDAAGEWQAKEHKLVDSLLKSYKKPLLLEEAIRYLARQWGALKDRLVKGKGGVAPTVSFLSQFHATIVPEAQEYSSLFEIKAEWTQWFKDNPDRRPPDDLRKRYTAAQPKLEALGLA